MEINLGLSELTLNCDLPNLDSCPKSYNVQISVCTPADVPKTTQAAISEMMKSSEKRPLLVS